MWIILNLKSSLGNNLNITGETPNATNVISCYRTPDYRVFNNSMIECFKWNYYVTLKLKFDHNSIYWNYKQIIIINNKAKKIREKYIYWKKSYHLCG